MSFKISFNSGKSFKNWSEILDFLKDDTLLFVLSTYLKDLPDLQSRRTLQIVPTYPALRNNSELSKNIEIAQRNYSGKILTPYLCPNNPKLQSLIRADFESLTETPQICGIQLESLVMPLQIPDLGCFCPHCHNLAEKRGINLHEISTLLTKRANNGLNLKWIQTQFPNWLKFRIDSVTNLAGRLMVTIRKINPELFLGLNINFSNNPKLLGHDYFFLALFLDNLNFIVNGNPRSKEKKLLKQIRSFTKKFLGDIKVFVQIPLQMNAPNEIKSNKIRKLFTRMQKYSFDGLIFQISTLEELKSLNRM